jgi:uncharacterized membrane protein YczE
LPLSIRSFVVLVTRLVRLYVGLVLFGTGIALNVHADLGLGPWDVLHQGLSEHTGIPIGTMNIIVGGVVLLAWIPLRQRPGIGTLSNAVVVGLVIDFVLWALPDVTSLWVRVPELLLCAPVIALGSGFYIGAGLGPGPRDGLMTGLARRGVASVRVVRTGIECTALVAGFLLGGSVGAGTLIIALTIGPQVQWFLDRLSLEPPPARSGRESPPLRGSMPPRTEDVTPPR